MIDEVKAEVARERQAAATPQWSPEMQVLLACARSYCAPPGSGLNLAAPLDSDRLLQTAAFHGMTSLLHHRLESTTPMGPMVAAPAGFLEALKERYRTDIRQGLQQTAVLLELMELFRSASLTALPYKGPALSAQIFGDAALREAVDLDILLPEDEVSAACERLAAVGFERARRYAPGIEKQLLRYRAEIAMMRDGVLVELQWRLAPKYFSVPLDVRALAARSTRVQVAGTEIPALSAEDNLLVLSIHGAKHHWQSLKWLLDVAMVIRMNPQLSWSTLLDRARAGGTERLLGLGLSLSETLLHTPLPADIRDSLRQDESICAAQSELLADLASGRSPTEAQHHRLMLRMRERFMDRARYVWRLGWQPTESEWESVALPRGLHFAYHGVRVGRVLAKALRSA